MAHQGGEGEYPSNVKLAFTQAHNAGADALDTDMFATANTAPIGQPSNSELVLFHDETLDARTNCTGPISDRDYNYLYQNCNFAYDWTQDGGATFPYRNSTDPNATKVVKVSELLDAFPNDRIGIEIKQTTAVAAVELCNVIKAKHAENRTLISSFSQPNMTAFRVACPTVATSATQDEGVQFYLYSQSTFPPGFNPPYSSLQVPEFFSGIQVVTPDTIADAHSFGLKVLVWTIDQTADAQRLKDLGVDGLNSSFPKRIIDFLPPPFLPHNTAIALKSPNGCKVNYAHGNYIVTAYAKAQYNPASGSCDVEQSYVELFSLAGSNWAVQRCYLLNATPGPGGQGECTSFGGPPAWIQAQIPWSSIISSKVHLCGEVGQPCTDHPFAGFPM
jgi:glycerophosphoryl diester phosphodiesterase